eukprot:scaffold20231_cov23-Cyclotella_meneghiniana.AAC.1
MTTSQREAMSPAARRWRRRATQSLMDSRLEGLGQKMSSSAWKRSQCRGVGGGDVGRAGQIASPDNISKKGKEFLILGRVDEVSDPSPAVGWVWVDMLMDEL